MNKINSSYFIPILDIPMFNRDIPEAGRLIIDSIEHNRARNECVSASGAHGLVYSKRNSEFKKILKDFSINLPDGMPGVWIGRLKGAKKMKRCYGPDFFKYFISETTDRGSIKHFLCGGKEGVADKLKDFCNQELNNNNIVGTFCPPFLAVDKYNYKEIAEIIKKSGANVVWIGLSTPKQENFAHFLSKYSEVAYIFCVGAAFDFHIGNVKQAPNWLQKAGLEWLFRLTMEPKRLWKRYIEIVPLFIYYNFAEIFSRRNK